MAISEQIEQHIKDAMRARDEHKLTTLRMVKSALKSKEIDKRAGQAAKTMPILLEVNLAGEASKFGYRPDALLNELGPVNALKRVEIRGLMTIAPWTPDAEKVRPIFRQLREMKERCEQILGAPLPHLSMGMSGDYKVAVEEGATMVRIGTALFGPRTQAKNTKQTGDPA